MTSCRKLDTADTQNWCIPELSYCRRAVPTVAVVIWPLLPVSTSFLKPECPWPVTQTYTYTRLQPGWSRKTQINSHHSSLFSSTSRWVTFSELFQDSRNHSYTEKIYSWSNNSQQLQAHIKFAVHCEDAWASGQRTTYAPPSDQRSTAWKPVSVSKLPLHWMNRRFSKCRLTLCLPQNRGSWLYLGCLTWVLCSTALTISSSYDQTYFSALTKMHLIWLSLTSQDSTYATMVRRLTYPWSNAAYLKARCSDRSILFFSQQMSSVSLRSTASPFMDMPMTCRSTTTATSMTCTTWHPGLSTASVALGCGWRTTDSSSTCRKHLSACSVQVMQSCASVHPWIGSFLPVEVNVNVRHTY